MELSQLLYATTLEKSKNFSRAADKLYISQPALSQQIQRLEQELGFPLFIRSSKRVDVTLAGERFLLQANAVMEEMRKLREVTDDINRVFDGKINFGCSIMSSPLITDGLASFISEFQKAQVEYIEIYDTIAIEMIREGTLDIALVSLPHDPDFRNGLRVLEIWDEHMCILMDPRHPLASHSHVTLQELEKERLIFSSPQSMMYRFAQQSFEDQGLSPRHVMFLNNPTARVPLIRKGVLNFVMNLQNLRSMPEDIVSIPIVPQIRRALCLVTSSGQKPSLIIQALQDTLQDCLVKELKEISSPN